MINALRFLANQQKDGDSPVKLVAHGVQESRRLRIMEGLRSFMLVDRPTMRR